MVYKRISLQIVWAAYVVFLVFMSSHSSHAAPDQSIAEERPKVGLVLSGGGARGIAHLGVIRVLEENRVPIDYITGTSMGSIIGGLYASGMSVAEIEETVNRIDWDGVFNDRTPRKDRSYRRKRDDDFALIKSKPGIDGLTLKLPQGLVQGQNISLLLAELTLPVATIKDFDQLSIPFRAVASDIVTGEPVVLGSGLLGQAIRASMSVPAAMAPVEIEGQLLVDGGISINLPMTVAREMGADVLIVVDISTPLFDREELDSTLEITIQLTGLLTQRGTQAQRRTLTPNDILIVPELGDITSGDFDRGQEAITVGDKAATENIAILRGLALSDVAYAMHVAARVKPSKDLPVIDFIRLDNQSRLSDDVLRARLTSRPGQRMDLDVVEADIRRIYGMELFQNVVWELVEENGLTGLVLHAKERPWGPNYLQFGLDIEGNFEGDNQFNLSLGYLGTAMNKLGGEWRALLRLGEEPGILAEVYQPLDAHSRYFVNPSIEVERDNVNLFEDGDVLAAFRVKRSGIVLAAGREFGTWGEFRLGWRRFTGENEVRVGDPALPTTDFDTGQGFVRFSVDELDSLYFPRSGLFGNFEWRFSRESLGDGANYEQFLFNGFGARSWGRHTLIGGLRYLTTPEDDAPIESLFRAGGFLRLSGFQRNELSGQHYAQVVGVYQRRLFDFNLMPTYAGVSVEIGNVWQDQDDITFDDTITAGSIYVGFDTFVGPIYFAYGLAEGGNSSFYSFLGTIF